MPNIDEAIEALLAYQQADMEGVMVLTSRQAIHEVADELRRLRSQGANAEIAGQPLPRGESVQTNATQPTGSPNIPADLMNVLLLIECGLDEPMAKRVVDQWSAKCAEVAALRRSPPECNGWRPIDAAPHETQVLLGWWSYDGEWRSETGMATHGWRRGAYSTLSAHGQATHWMPLPAAPDRTDASPREESTRA